MSAIQKLAQGFCVGGGIGGTIGGAVGGVALLHEGKSLGWWLVAASVLCFFCWQDAREWE